MPKVESKSGELGFPPWNTYLLQVCVPCPAFKTRTTVEKHPHFPPSLQCLFRDTFRFTKKLQDMTFLYITHLVSDSDAGRDWGQEEKGMTEDEIVG